MIRLEHIHIEIGNKLLLEDEEIEVHEGYIHVIMGESGSGKTTLLHEISLLSDISECTYIWNDIRVDRLSDYEKSNIRRNNIGYILQDLELISEELSLRDNLVCMASLSGREYDEEIVLEYMHKLNLYTQLDESIESMSRGERQRFALVLALIKDAELIICDEPTSALDIDNSHELMKYLELIARDYHKMIVIATHDDIVAEYADLLYFIKDKHLIVKKNDNIITREYKDKELYCLDQRFYKVYMNAHKNLVKYIMKVIYTVMVVVLCLSPAVLEHLLDKQQELFELFADEEIIVSNTEERLPYSTYNPINEDFSESVINMLKEIDNVHEIRCYWEMDGIVNIKDKKISVKILPKNNINIITISSSLSEAINDKSKIDAYLDYSMNSYHFNVNLNEYVVKDYPLRKGIDRDIIYIPYSMLKELLKDEGITSSSSVSVICEDITLIEDTIKEIERWMSNSTVSSESLQYISQINMLENISKYITVLRIILIIGIISVAYIVNVMENKTRKKEITTLRINGFNKNMFYKLSYYENINNIIITILLVIVSYIVFLFINNKDMVILNIIIILIESLVYIGVTKILPVIVTIQEIFRKDISSILRDY